MEELPERYFLNRHRVAKIGQVLKDVLPRRNTSNEVYYRVKNAWQHILGEEVCQCTEIVNLKGGVLYVNVESAALIHHLTNFEKHAIIDRLNEMIGMKGIEDIRFKAGMLNGTKRK